MWLRDPNIVAVALFSALVVGAIGVVAYGQPVEFGAPRPGAASSEHLEDLALDLKTRERLLDRREDLSSAGLQTAEERIRSRLQQLQQMRDEVDGRIGELQTLRDQTAKLVAELNERRASEQRDLKEARARAEAEIEGKRKSGLADLELRRKQMLAEVGMHRRDALARVEERRTELLAAATEQNDEDVMALVQMVEAMRPAEAGAVLVETKDSLAVQVLEKMGRGKAGKALATMDPKKAAALAERMADPPTYRSLGVGGVGSALGGGRPDGNTASTPSAAPGTAQPTNTQ
jgi:flagellar motility protein MotE (MotC chaperone)